MSQNVSGERPISALMNDAASFYSLGREEITQGRRKSDPTVLREGAEKVFHALLYACEAQVRKYGLPAPHDHEGVRSGLTCAREVDLKSVYDEAFSVLHRSVYYRGFYDYDKRKVDRLVTQIGDAMDGVRRTVERRGKQMPIGLEEFKSGVVLTDIRKSVLEFLKRNPGKAYNTSEILRAVGYTEGDNITKALAANLAIDQTLRDLMRMRKIVGRRINFTDYYAVSR